MKKRILVLIIVMVFLNFSASLSQEVKNGEIDETVYVMLDNSGRIDYLKVVDRLQTEGNGVEYTDKEIKSAELPVIISLKYNINGREIAADKLAGSSGELKIHISVVQNDAVAEELRGVYMTQIQIPLNLKHVRIKAFDGTSSVVTGEMTTLTYAVLPDTNQTFELLLEVKDFQMDSIQIALVEYSADISSQFEGILDGIDTMEEKANEMIDGTTVLKNGMSKLSKGAGELNGAVDKLNSGAVGLAKGIDEYSIGVNDYQIGLSAAADGVASSFSGIKQLNAGAAPLLKGYEELAGALKQLEQNHSKLLMLAQKLQNSTDPELQALYLGVAAEAGGISHVAAGLSEANKGLSGFFGGLGNIEAGMGELNQGINLLPSGFAQLKLGFEKLGIGFKGIAAGLSDYRKGFSIFSTAVTDLPSKVQELADGQVKFKEGIIEFKTQLKSGISPKKKAAPVSFIDSRKEVKSLQFILKTPEIKKAEADDGTETNREIKQTWIQLIWDRLTGLFK